jgi:hypothetical protein
MGRPISEAIAELQHLEDTDQAEAAEELRAKFVAAGLEDQIPVAKGPAKPPEQSFLDQWGRPIAEGAGALSGGFLGLPAGIPGVMAGAAFGGEAAGYGYDKLGEMFGKEAPIRSPKDMLTSAAYNSMGGPAGPAGKAPAMLAGKVPEGGLFDVANKGPITAGDKVEEHGGRWTAANRGSPSAQRWEASSQSSPFAVDIMTEHTERNLNALSEVVEEATPTATSRNIAGTRAGMGHPRKNLHG